MKQTSLREQFLQFKAGKKVEKSQRIEETVKVAPMKTEVAPEPPKEETKPVRRRRKKVELDDDDD